MIVLWWVRLICVCIVISSICLSVLCGLLVWMVENELGWLVLIVCRNEMVLCLCSLFSMMWLGCRCSVVWMRLLGVICVLLSLFLIVMRFSEFVVGSFSLGVFLIRIMCLLGGIVLSMVLRKVVLLVEVLLVIRMVFWCWIVLCM